MSDFIKQYVKDRRRAFADVLYNDSLKELKKYCKKYDIQMPEGKAEKRIVKAGVLKAIQECTDFSEEDKTLAMQKALDMGINPFMKPYDYDEQIKEQNNEDTN